MDRAEAFEAALKLQPGKTALVVVDMQRGFLDPGEVMEVPPARDIVPRIRSLLDLFRDRGLPVLFTEFTYSECAPLLVGELHPEHRKPAPGAPRGLTHLVLTGTMTDICVLATVVGGMNREYRMTVVEDATATLSPEIQRASLDIIRRAYGRVLSTGQVFEEVAGW